MISQCPEFTHLLALPRLRVQNANAISSPLTHGFPAMTAFLGVMWALGRKAHAAGLNHLAFQAVGVICHGWQELSAPDSTAHSPLLFRQTRNPLDRGGKTAAIVEEGRIHLDMSLVFALRIDEQGRAHQKTGLQADGQASLPDDLQAVADWVSGMRIAGGSVLPAWPATLRHRPFWIDVQDGADGFRELRARLLPGFALVLRDDVIDSRLQLLRRDDPHATRLDAWLSLSRVDRRYEPEAEQGKGAWVPSRQAGSGWLVPIPVGYGALSGLYEPGSVPNARDKTAPFRFVECLYSAGEWIGAHRLRTPQELLWYASGSADQGLYRCRNDYCPHSDGDVASPI